MTELFKAWPKIPRLSNEKEFYTEKIDGTNACIICTFEETDHQPIAIMLTEVGPLYIHAQSRNKLITPNDDNYGFASWVQRNFQELSKLGEGYHYGEWWGLGIQRGYNQTEKRFSLFNTKRWGSHNPNTPTCCSVVPTIHATSIEEATNILKTNGSLAAPGYDKIEGIVVYKYMTDSYYKIIIDKE